MQKTIRDIMAGAGIILVVIFGLVLIRLSFDTDKALSTACILFVSGAVLLFLMGFLLWVIDADEHDRQFRSLEKKIDQMEDSITDYVATETYDVLDGQQKLRELVKSIQTELAELKSAPRLSWLQKLLRRK